jgi:2-polyprenyl-3-methyl-5-hydroxy-6-metoxy-1,4-benzoquinol methylase
MKEISYYNQSRPDVASLVPENTKSILDIGCGQGAFLKLVKENIGAETWGVEQVFEIAEEAKNRADNILTGKVEDVIGSIPNAYFDCITFNDVLEHLLEPIEILNLIKAKLSPEGTLIASIPNVRYFLNLYELLIKKDWEYKDFGILDSTHVRFFTKKSMKRMFENAGYKILKINGTSRLGASRSKILNFFDDIICSDTKYCQFIIQVKVQ